MSKDNMIPKLRFPEFVNADEWKLDNVNSLFDLQDGYSFSSQVFTSNHENAQQVIRITDINNRNKNSEKVYIPEEKVNDLGIVAYSVDKGDLLLSLTGAAGFNFYIWENGEAFINQRTMKITPRDLKNESLKVLLSPLIHEIINGIGTGQNNNLSKDALKAVEFPIPQPKEQQKIASCLSSLDELLAAHNEKLDALKDHKKGLMQNLFPKDGETVPKVRFKEFEGDGKWVEKSLESLTDKIGDGIHSTPKYDQSGDYYFINGNNLTEGKIIVDEKTKKVSSNEFEKHKKDLTDKTIFLSINGTIGNVAFYNNERVVLGKSACYITPNHELNNVFLYYSLQSPKISNYFFSELTGSTIKNLSLRTIRDTAFNLPSEKEQQKIASCLSAVDELISAQTDKIEQLQQHKKGMMQGLFPKIES